MDRQEQQPNRPLYEPTILDVLVVRAMLNRGLGLLPEVIDEIVDYAEYWPHSTASAVYDPVRVASSGRTHSVGDVFLIRSQPLGFPRHPAPRDARQAWSAAGPEPKPLEREHSKEALQKSSGCPISLVEHPCRKIVFTINSHDQGWSSDVHHHGTYQGSWTWFDAGLERSEASSDTSTDAASFAASNLRSVWPEVRTDVAGVSVLHHDLLPSAAHKVQANVLARREFKEHRVTWSYLDDTDPSSAEAERLDQELGRGRATADGKFVRALRLGDMVTLWARARFPNWTNKVQSVQIDVYWVV